MQRRRASPADFNSKTEATSTKCTLGLLEQFFLFLVRVKQGFPVEDLAVKFRVSRPVLSVECFWRGPISLYFLYGQIPICPSKAQVKANLPECFKTAYPDTCAILDCTEIKVRRPTAKVLNSEFYSSYNSHATYKGLVGIAPNGTVTFISSLFQGSMSDKEITRQSGVVS